MRAAKTKSARPAAKRVRSAAKRVRPATTKTLSHVDARGHTRMVDVSEKPATVREAVASGFVQMAPATLRLIGSGRIAKGDPLQVARLAGIMAAKKTSEIIPLCHPLAISHCAVEFEIPKSRDRILITARVKVAGQTGVEMEALTAVSVAALTIYDMCKAVDKQMRITEVRLVLKRKRSLERAPRAGPKQLA